ncbi:phosphate ABC transporter substrate-binding protein PstS family protein [Fortiea contorta]|uniref:PstS family phosphate ABC transporter substrate-binding protein n=1 Tax=Fortiea contorta TaxID=1892405 RepID=UPI00034BD2E1
MCSQTRNWAFVISLVTLGVAACSGQNLDTTVSFPEAVNKAKEVSASEKLTGSIKIDGSSTVFPISKAMVEAFQKSNPGVQIAVGVSGTGGGFKKFCANETDISGASRPINAEEMELCKQNNVEFIELPIAFDGLAIVVNPQNNFAQCLKLGELRKMWEPGAQGKISNWNQVRSSFPNQPLSLYGPDKESGTYDYFTLAVVGEEGKSRSDFSPSKTDTALVEGIAANPNALGYFGYAYYLANQNKLKLLAVDSGSGCVQPSPQTIADSRYQPLSRPVFIYVKKSAVKRPEVKAFSSFYVSPDNANLILQVGDVPLPSVALEAAGLRLDNGQTGTKFGGKGSVLGVKQDALK